MTDLKFRRIFFMPAVWNWRAPSDEMTLLTSLISKRKFQFFSQKFIIRFRWADRMFPRSDKLILSIIHFEIETVCASRLAVKVWVNILQVRNCSYSMFIVYLIVIIINIKNIRLIKTMKRFCLFKDEWFIHWRHHTMACSSIQFSFSVETIMKWFVNWTRFITNVDHGIANSFLSFVIRRSQQIVCDTGDQCLWTDRNPLVNC